ncbi:MAG: tetratricopeptide repeat protein [Patescibacteria group bacterium]|nr:tetratricopeptide repeat protein [Patescibacteria group bacterium]
MVKIKKLLQNRKIQLAIIVLVTIIAYINILPNGFAWDDRDFFIDWPQIKNSEGLPAYLSVPALLEGDLPLNHRGIYRPLRSMYYLASYAIWGQNPLGYHIQAIIVHTLAALVIYLIVELITKKRLPAFFTAVLFATHPIHTEAVTYITASMDTVGILFFFLSFYLYLKSTKEKIKKNTYLLASVIYGFLAIFTYEMTLVLPLMILLYDFCTNNFSLKKLLSKINTYKYFILLPVIYALIRFVVLRIGNRADYLGVGWQVAANQARVSFPETIAHYLSLLAWPVNLTISPELSIKLLDAFMKLLYKISPTGYLVDLSTHIVFIFPVIYSALAILIAYKICKKYPLVFFGVCWIIITLLPVSNIIPQGATIAERFLYIPSFGFVFLIGFLLYHCFIFLEKNRRLIYRRFSLALILFFLLTTAFYTFQTIKRNADWRDEKNIWLAAMKLSPNQPRSYIALGVNYSRDGQYDKAISFYKKAADLDPSDVTIIISLGLTYTQKGEFENAKAQYQKAINISPKYYLAHVDLGDVYIKQGEYELARKEYQSALDIKKNDPAILSYLGSVYYNEKEYDKAIEAFNKSLELDSNQPKVYLGLASSYKQKGEIQKAIEILKRANKDLNNPEIQKEIKNLENS